jgi:hypothetical protein
MNGDYGNLASHRLANLVQCYSIYLEVTDYLVSFFTQTFPITMPKNYQPSCNILIHPVSSCKVKNQLLIFNVSIRT